MKSCGFWGMRREISGRFYSLQNETKPSNKADFSFNLRSLTMPLFIERFYGENITNKEEKKGKQKTLQQCMVFNAPSPEASNSVNIWKNSDEIANICPDW